MGFLLTGRATLGLVALLFSAAAFAQTHHHHDMAAGGGAGSGAEVGAFAAFDAQGTLWAAHKDHGYVVLSRSQDLGRSWSAPVRVTSGPEKTDAGGDARPKVAIGSGGEIYVTWTKALAKPFTGEIRFSRSLDGGHTFSAPIRVHADAQVITHRFDSMAVSADGKIFVSWIDKRDGVAAATTKKTPAYQGAAVYFAVSEDRGSSFHGDYKLAEHSCECCRIAMLPERDGSVLAMWRHVFEPGIRDHAVGRMLSDGRTASVRRATFDDWRSDVCPHHGPSLARDADGVLHAVWFTLAPGRSGIFYGRLRDGAVDGQRRVGGEAAEHADLATVGNRVAVAWKEFDGERSQLRAMVSDGAGDSWRELQLGSTNTASDQPRVLVRGERFYAFWNTVEKPLWLVEVK